MPSVQKFIKSLPWIVTIGIALVFLGPKLDSQFSFEDDILIVEFVNEGSFLNTLKKDILNDWGLGRLRPVYWTVNRIIALFLGDNPFYWHIASLIFFLISLYGFYWILFRLVDDSLAALLGTVSTFLVSALLMTYIRLSPAEIFANGFLLAAVAYKIKNVDDTIVSSILLLSAFFCKETYLFFFPIILVSENLNSRFLEIMRTKTVKQVLGSAIISASFLAVLLLSVGQNSYGFVSYEEESMGILPVIANSISDSIAFMVALPFALYGMYKNPRFRNLGLLVFALALAQFAIYLYRGKIMPHYFYPAFFSVGFISAIGFTYINSKLKKSHQLVFALFILILTFGWNRFSPHRSADYSAETKVLQSMIDRVAEDTTIRNLAIVHPVSYSVGRGETIQYLISLNGNTIPFTDFLSDTLQTLPNADAIVFSRIEEHFPHAYALFEQFPFDYKQEITSTDRYFHLSSLSFKYAKATTYIYYP